MDIKTALLEEHSKAQAMKIVRYIGSDQKRFDELLKLFLTNEYRISQRAAFSLGHACQARPYLIAPNLRLIIENLQDDTVHDAVKRNTVRILQDIDIPEDLLGLTADICFRYLNDPKVAVAIRVFSMSVLYNICKKEPDLSNELKLVIQDHYEHGTAGFKSRGKKILKQLNKK